MKRISLLILCLMFGAAEAKNGKTKLLQPLSLADGVATKQVEAELSPLLKDNSKAQGAKLIGKINVTKRNGKTITQFVFGGIETKDTKKSKRQVVLLKKPIVGGGICTEENISAEDIISLQYTEEELAEALENLLNEQNLATKPKTFKVANPLGELVDSSDDLETRKSVNKKSNALSEGLTKAEDITTMQTNAQSGSSPSADLLAQDSANPEKEKAAEHANYSAPSLVNYGNRGAGASRAISPNILGDLRREGEAFPRRDEAARNDAEPGRTPPIPTTNETLPKREVSTTADGCPPRIDRVHNKVIIQEKTITTEDGKVVETSACEDTLEQYDIYKDFLCEGCEPFVDAGRRVAFDKYKAFWLNGENAKQVLDEETQNDLTLPHPFIDEERDCSFEIDDILGMAYPRVATIFADRFNGKHVVEACHRVLTAPGYRIVDANCPIEHDFAGNRSYLRKKKVFSVEGVEHLAHDCARAGDAIPHEFITTACQSIVDPNTGAITPLARRRIHTPNGNQFISECEPLADTNLLATTEGCEDDLFSHDFVTGRSYFNKRYYYTNTDGARIYSTPCVRSAEAVSHEFEEAGYQHDDTVHVSFKKTAIFIAFRLLNIPQRQQIAEPTVRPGAESVAHVLVRTENRANGAPVYQGCHRVSQSQIIQHYNRPDGTTYEVVAGVGVPVQGPDECKIVVRIREGRDAYNAQTLNHIAQTHRVYPDGRTELLNTETFPAPIEIFSLRERRPEGDRSTYSYTCRVTGVTRRYHLLRLNPLWLSRDWATDAIVEN